MTNIYDLILNSNVLVQRKGNTSQKGNWEGLYKLVAIDRESCVLALLRGNTTFRSTSVKPFHEGDIKIDDKPKYDPELHDPELYNEGKSNTGIIPPAILVILLKRNRGRPYKYPNIIVFV